MKLKTIFIGSFLFLLIFLIYLNTKDSKVYYLNLGDSLALGMNSYGVKDYGYSDVIKDYLKEKKLLQIYNSSFAQMEYRTTDLIRDIKENKKGKQGTIKNALIKADLVTLSIGYLDLYSRLNPRWKEDATSYDTLYTYVDEAMEDMKELLKLLRQYCKEDILMLGYYNPKIEYTEEANSFYHYLNQQLKKVCDQYEITLIPIYELFQENKEFLINGKLYPTKKGYRKIGEQFLIKIEQKLLK